MKILMCSMFCLLLCGSPLQGSEEKYLENIKQLTFPSMGFEKAGEAYFSPNDELIIFQAVPNGQKHYQMFVMPFNQSSPKLVSTGKGACTCGYFHPYEEKIIFGSSHEDPAPMELPPSTGKYRWDFTPYMNIYAANIDGTSLKPLTSGPAYHAECAYSSDGTRIVYASNEDGSMNLYTMNADGSEKRQITHTTHCYNGGPFFSPNGKQILFRADRDKPNYLQIYMINSDGTDEKQLTSNNSVNWAPYWHPNGKVIAFTTSIHGHHRYEVYLLNVETGVQVRLTNCEDFDGLPVFNKEGTKIMWTSKRGQDKTSQVFVADFTMPQELI